MADYKISDIVVLTAGSPRMAVEVVDGDQVSTVWCNEGVIYRDTFNTLLLKKWETREYDRGGDRGGARSGGGYKGGGKPYGSGDRDGGGYKGGGKPFGGDRDRGGDRGDKRSDDRGPKGKPGWDGKPREKKFFRKD